MRGAIKGSMTVLKRALIFSKPLSRLTSISKNCLESNSTPLQTDFVNLLAVHVGRIRSSSDPIGIQIPEYVNGHAEIASVHELDQVVDDVHCTVG